ncbi:methyl-accepting chemotaxis protein [Sphingomonas sp. PP-CE-1G-424]|uniref:methyl-accepting chemotaxis protein n=1 Tax=Sphingomonas sp. PP-CE-1G-424 TaxID=2135658 RepID=UPI0010542FD1|nr:methyl-accepting chemotaxis protein [Sphingomonas sp. PP-CE-1G-424]TCP73248.1 methyl-accepting chemotaxis protein [Sphingomonas sp. PP-CE-1G-424]
MNRIAAVLKPAFSQLNFGAKLGAAAKIEDDAGLNPLDRLRRRAVQAWAAIGWISLGGLLIGNAVLGAGASVPLLVIGAIITAGPTAMALRGRYDVEARTLMGSLAAVIPAMLVFLLKGHPWQMDAHMYFFVGMAALVMLADWRPIALATVLTAVHHLALEWWAPEFVFTGTGNLGRVIFHVVAVGLQFGALTVLTIQLERLFRSQSAALRRSRELTELAEDGQRRTEEAMHQARAAEAVAARERQQREDQATRIASERRGELVALANEFDHSVTSVVKSIGQATERLEHAAVRLEDVTGGATQDAVEAASGAGRAARDIAHVASSIRDLSESIRTIAIAADQQSELTVVASLEAQRSVQTVAMLEDHAVQIEVFLDDIRELASKTNLLALNATIEAARAGDAGRGFAVVAGEVKVLSADTKRASDRISTLLAGIREGVADTGEKLRSVNTAIGQVSVAASGIATAVGEQRFTAQEVDAGTARAVDAADEIGTRIDGVAAAAGSASLLSASVRGSASDLAASARNLRSSTDLFVSFLQSDDAAAA